MIIFHGYWIFHKSMLQISWISSSFFIMRHCCLGERCGPWASCCQFLTLNIKTTLSHYETLNLNYKENKRLIGHTAHLRNEFKSMNIWAKLWLLIGRRKSSLIEWSLLFNLENQGCFVSSLVEIGPVVLKKSFKFCKCNFAIS